ncbi:MAG: TerC family protein [Hyphomicrobiaceae bacterium]
MGFELAASFSEQMMPWLNSVFGSYGGMILQVLQIIGIDIILSGDNAVVIALACRSLPEDKRRMGIILGVAAAIILRVIFTLGLQFVIGWPWLMVVGGFLLLWIAVQLLVESDDSEKVIADNKTLAGAVRTIALADVVMSLDNVLAIAGAAHGQPGLILFGLLLSIPLIMGGATLIIGLLTRFPILVWAGAALLGWIAGELIASERMLTPLYISWAQSLGFSINLAAHAPNMPPTSILHAGGVIGAGLVLLIGFIAQARRSNRHTAAS